MCDKVATVRAVATQGNRKLYELTKANALVQNVCNKHAQRFKIAKGWMGYPLPMVSGDIKCEWDKYHDA